MWFSLMDNFLQFTVGIDVIIIHESPQSPILF